MMREKKVFESPEDCTGAPSAHRPEEGTEEIPLVDRVLAMLGQAIRFYDTACGKPAAEKIKSSL